MEDTVDVVEEHIRQIEQYLKAEDNLFAGQSVSQS